MSDEPVDDVLVRAASVAKDVVFLGDVGVHSLVIVKKVLILVVTGQFLLETGCNPLPKIPS